MDLTRTVAVRLAKDGVLVIEQKGRVIDQGSGKPIRGPIRLRLAGKGT